MTRPRRGDWSDVPVDPALAKRAASALVEARAEPWSAEAWARVDAKLKASVARRDRGARTRAWIAGIAGIALAGGAAALWDREARAPREHAAVSRDLAAPGGHAAATRDRPPPPSPTAASGGAAVVVDSAAGNAVAARGGATARESATARQGVVTRERPPRRGVSAQRADAPSREIAGVGEPPAAPGPPRSAPPRDVPAPREPAAAAIVPDGSVPLLPRTATTTYDAGLALRSALDHLAAGRLLPAHHLARSAAEQQPSSPVAAELRLVELEAALRLRRPRLALDALQHIDLEAHPRRVELTVVSAELWAAVDDCPRARMLLAPVLADDTTAGELRARAQRVCR